MLPLDHADDADWLCLPTVLFFVGENFLMRKRQGTGQRAQCHCERHPWQTLFCTQARSRAQVTPPEAAYYTADSGRLEWDFYRLQAKCMERFFREGRAAAVLWALGRLTGGYRQLPNSALGTIWQANSKRRRGAVLGRLGCKVYLGCGWPSD